MLLCNIGLVAIDSVSNILKPETEIKTETEIIMI